jgi:hypothetical protein
MKEPNHNAPRTKNRMGKHLQPLWLRMAGNGRSAGQVRELPIAELGHAHANARAALRDSKECIRRKMEQKENA